LACCVFLQVYSYPVWPTGFDNLASKGYANQGQDKEHDNQPNCGLIECFFNAAPGTIDAGLAAKDAA
jgi:hypothetical protein